MKKNAPVSAEKKGLKSGPTAAAYPRIFQPDDVMTHRSG
jgi:hypothetical protein